MLSGKPIYKYWTNDYKHEYFFMFNGNKYRVHSIVRLTDEGKCYFGSKTKEVILTEQFVNWDNNIYWKYSFTSVDPAVGVTNASTYNTPDELIEDVVLQATADYTSREMFGIDSPVYKTGIKHQKRDWEIPELVVGWIVFVVVFLGVAIFKDWYVQWIIRIAACWIFGFYRQSRIDAYTTYTHDEDNNMLRKKYEILYGIKNNKGDNDNE